MKATFLFLTLLLAVSCNKKNANGTEQLSDAATSTEYEAYVAAYRDYVTCVAARPQLTNDLLSNKIDGAQFELLLEKNTTVCSLKRKLYLTYFDILSATYPEEAAMLQADTDLGE
jgi:hypothetical protein